MYRQTKRHGMRLAACVLGLLTAVGCSNPAEKLTIAEASQPAFALLYIADANGYLKEAGLDVTFTSFRLGRDALTSVIEGKADLATVYETPVVIRLAEGKRLGILATLHTSTRNTALAARRDSGIAHPADLKGKRIGATKGTNADYFLSLFLATESIPAASVTRVELEPGDYERALVQREVDGLVLFEPYQTRVRRALGDRSVTFYSDAYVEVSMLVGMRDTLATRPAAMARLAGALVKAQDYAEAHREESIRIVVARLGGIADESAVRDGWDNFKREAALNHILLSSMTLEAQWLRDADRFSGALPEVADAIVAGPLRSVRPHAVTLQARTPGR